MSVALMIASAAVVFTLGAVHLILTFVGPKLTPRDPELQARMREVSPVITQTTTMWRCWLGFNASHSMAALLFGLIYGYLAIAHSSLLFSSPFLLTVGVMMLSGFLLLAWLYWFRTPQLGVGISLVCFLASIVAAPV